MKTIKPRKYLTKSKFKVGLSCPRKLFYLDKPDEYADNKLDDPFLQALARGGYQVGELAKVEYPEGIEVTEREHVSAVQATQALLEKENCVIFEAAFMYGPFFVRSDIVVKKGNNIRLIEVKSKSLDPAEFRDEIWNKKAGKGVRKLKSEWYEYIYDLAFQVWVARQAHPQLNILGVFKGVNKTKKSTVNGLNSLFLIKKTESRGFKIERQGHITSSTIGESILAEVDLTDAVNDIIDGNEKTEFVIKKSFAELAVNLGQIYKDNLAYPAKDAVAASCKKCEFRAKDSVLKSGFAECWLETKYVKDTEISKPFVFDVGRFSKGNEYLEDGIYLMKNMDPESIPEGKDNGKTGMPQYQRQRLQIVAERDAVRTPTFEIEELKEEMSSWNFPYHFIDFETCAPALPFNSGRRPYENVAFQFSHHIMSESGQIVHAGQYINLNPGEFPNFDFVRHLKSQLEKDNGTIFRYSHHENTVLNQIVKQLQDSEETDKETLIQFIRTITNHTPEGSKIKIHGPREMVDLCDMVLRFYYSPRMGGSASIKYVLPAILNESDYLKKKYAAPIYGTKQMPSLNFQNQIWVKTFEEGETSNPYDELPKIFDPSDLARIESFVIDDDDVRNGGAAMMAYCMAQFVIMTELERERIKQALLRYCELDTLAMVMIVEYWQSVIAKTAEESQRKIR